MTEPNTSARSATTNVINFVSFQLGWQACTWSAVYDRHWMCVPVVIFLAGLALVMSRDRRSEVLLYAMTAVIGVVIDQLMLATGIFTFANGPMDSVPERLIVVLWSAAFFVNFATTLNASLAWLSTRPGLGVLLGATGGPPAYWTGEKMGAITLGQPMWISLAVLALLWGVLTPLLFWILRQIQKTTEDRFNTRSSS